MPKRDGVVSWHLIGFKIMSCATMLKFNEFALSPQICSLHCSMVMNIKCRFQESVVRLDPHYNIRIRLFVHNRDVEKGQYLLF